MYQPTQQMRDFAADLIAYESSGNESSRTKNPAVFSVYEKLHPSLAALMGTIGVRTLFLRSLELAGREVPSLCAVQVKTDGSLAGLDKLEVQADPEQLAKGNAVLVAQLLGLLVSFIGEKLTLQLVREIWPKLSVNDLELGKGDQNGKTN